MEVKISYMGAMSRAETGKSYRHFKASCRSFIKLPEHHRALRVVWKFGALHTGKAWSMHRILGLK